MKTSINTIIFDLGNVIADFDFTPVVNYLREVNAEMHSVDEFIDRCNVYAYERGEVSSEEFIKQIESATKTNIDAQLFSQHWNSIFEPNHQILALIQELNQKYRTFLISNTNDLHFQFLNEELSLSYLFQDIITSHTVGVMKPDPKIFEIAESRFQLDVPNTVFIDDRPEHVASAKNRGWNVIQHINFQTTFSELKQLGLV